MFNARIGLDACRSVLRRQMPAIELLATQELDSRRIAAALRDMATFAERTIQAMTNLSDEPHWAAQMHILSRSVFDVGLKALWATRTANGWLILTKDWARQEVTMRSEAVKLKHRVKVWEQKRLYFQAVIEEIAKREPSLPPLPSVDAMLGDIEGIIASKIGPAADDSGKALYVHLFRSACHPTHGHINAMVPTEPDYVQHKSTLTAAFATNFLVRAVHENAPQSARKCTEDAVVEAYRFVAEIAYSIGER